MPSYMEGYGTADEKRGRWLKRIFFVALPVLLLGTAAFFYFRTWSQERVVAHFVDAIKQKDFDGAYKLWCPADKPCRYYPMEKFQEDWGPTGKYANLATLKIQNVDYCDGGVVFESFYPNAEPFGLWVEKSTGLISFAPWQRCPGPHLQLGPFFRRIFG
ncbi:MAG: hypothetical protein ABI811_02590 [Acidobacteriota bacterium]